MPLSTPGLKFLLDENVKIVLFTFLTSRSFDAKLVTKSVKDSEIAKVSKKEKRILITNDHDFQWYTKDQIYSVILLDIPQNDSKALIYSIEKLLKEFSNFPERTVLLGKNGWTDFSLWEDVR